MAAAVLRQLACGGLLLLVVLVLEAAPASAAAPADAAAATPRAATARRSLLPVPPEDVPLNSTAGVALLYNATHAGAYTQLSLHFETQRNQAGLYKGGCTS
jgi:hypothetical protein